MPRPQWKAPRDPDRSFDTRTEGLCGKAIAMMHLNARIALYIERGNKRICFKTHPDMVPLWDGPEVDQLEPSDFLPERGGELRILPPTKSSWRNTEIPRKTPSSLSSPSLSFFSMNASRSSSLNSDSRTEQPNPVTPPQVLSLPLPLSLPSASSRISTSSPPSLPLSLPSASSHLSTSSPPRSKSSKRTFSDPPPPITNSRVQKKRKLSTNGKKWIQ
ncbi:hypothetical protein V8F33_001720 [Rhypophila sp. PSN 637]